MTNKKIGWSFEVFPPKRTSKVSTIYSTLADLKKLNPDFISVTYGAGGSDNCKATVEIANAVKNHYDIESIAHLPCISLSKSDAIEQLSKFKEIGVSKILALRGDLPLNESSAKTDFKYASDLVKFIKEYDSSFDVLGACYPETHYESKSWQEDIEHLKIKVDMGVSTLISQLFFSNDLFYTFIDRIHKYGINVPVEAGIMPVINCKQIERMVDLCKVKLPQKFVTVMNKYRDDPNAMLEIGIAYAVDQIIDLAANGVDGIHLYTMNNPIVATKISNAVTNVLGRA